MTNRLSSVPGEPQFSQRSLFDDQASVPTWRVPEATATSGIRVPLLIQGMIEAAQVVAPAEDRTPTDTLRRPTPVQVRRGFPHARRFGQLLATRGVVEQPVVLGNEKPRVVLGSRLRNR